MAAGLAMLFICLSVVFIFCFLNSLGNGEKSIVIYSLLLLITIILILITNFEANKKLISIGEQVEGREVIGYEDRIILLKEGGSIEVPWYVHVSESELFSENQYYITVNVDEIPYGVYIMEPEQEKKRIYSSKMKNGDD